MEYLERRIKVNRCKELGIKLLVIPYWEKDLNNVLKQLEDL